MEEQLTINIRFFARAKEIVDTSEISIDIQSGTTTDNLKEILTRKYPALDTIVNHLLLSVNNEYVTGERILESGDEVACFPPVSGG